MTCWPTSDWTKVNVYEGWYKAVAYADSAGVLGILLSSGTKVVDPGPDRP